MTSRTPIALLACAAVIGLAACDRASTATAERNAATAGQRIDKALDRTQQRLAEAGEKTQQKLAAAGERLQPQLAEAGERISQAGQKVASEVKEAVGTDGSGASTTTTIKTGPRTSVSGLPEGTRAALSDTAITASINADYLKDPGLSVLQIDVDTRDGVVTLNGLADSEPARVRAGQLAGGVKGVREVRNHLTVKRG